MKYKVGQRLTVKYSKDYFKEYVNTIITICKGNSQFYGIAEFKGTTIPWDGWTNEFIENPYHFEPINKIENWRGYLNDGR
jgi:hypothetical protein